jgi:succinate dehydrogenase / fumarate reductase flavoprotein subunit
MESWDVIVVGSGIAALRAAIAASDSGATVTVIESRGPGSSQSLTCSTGIAASISESDHFEHGKNTTLAGSGLSDTIVVEQRCSSATAHLTELERWGYNFQRNESGTLKTTDAPGHSSPRICSAGDSTGREMVRILEEQCMKRGIPRKHDLHTISVCTENQRVRGVVVLDIQTGVIAPIQSKSVILATNDHTGLWNDEGGSGLGASLALRAGAKLRGMEFLSWYPLCVPTSNYQLPFSLIAAGARLRKSDGEDVELSGSSITEISLSLMDDSYVLDARNIPSSERVWFSTTEEILNSRFGIDLWSDVIPLEPQPNFAIGGVAVDEQGRALISPGLWLTGLYACGGSSCSGMHGADMLPGNRLLDDLIGGSNAGTSSAKWCSTVGFGGREALYEMALVSEDHIESLSRSESGNSVGAMTASLRRLMNSNMSLEREFSTISSCAEKIEEMVKEDIRLSDESFIMNTELIQALELQGMLALARTIASVVGAREESRGSHRRADFPDQDENNESKSYVIDAEGIMTTLN